MNSRRAYLEGVGLQRGQRQLTLLEQAQSRFVKAEFYAAQSADELVVVHDGISKYARLHSAGDSRAIIVQQPDMFTGRRLALGIFVQNKYGVCMQGDGPSEMRFDSYAVRSDGSTYKLPPPPAEGSAAASLLHDTAHHIRNKTLDDPGRNQPAHLDLRQAFELYCLLAYAQPVQFETGHDIV
jgi:hypothetical protein